MANGNVLPTNDRTLQCNFCWLFLQDRTEFKNVSLQTDWLRGSEEDGMKACSVAAISFVVLANPASAMDWFGATGMIDSSVSAQGTKYRHDDRKIFELNDQTSLSKPDLPASASRNGKFHHSDKGTTDFAPIRLTDNLRLGGVTSSASNYLKHLGGMALPPAGFLLQYTGPVGLNMLLLPPTANNEAAFSVQLKYRY